MLCRCAWLVLSIVLAGLPVPLSATEDAAARTRELGELRTRIHHLQNRLEVRRKQKTREEKALRDIDREINVSRKALGHTEKRLNAVIKQLAELQRQRQEETRQLGAQRDQLAYEARSAYVMGRQKQVKLLLNQEQPDAVGRVLTYFGYFTRARAEKIDAMNASIKRLQVLQGDIEKKSRVLSELKGTQRARITQLAEQKQLRKKAVAELRQQLAKQGGALKQLQVDERRLQELVHSLQELLADIPADTAHNKPFKALKGALNWPARGQLSVRFGTPRGDSGLAWQGVLITAPEGGKVHAVAQGRVAFSDWMRGFGLLLIIDHGDGYMSLYGHNQALYKEVGEWVDSGETVATLGASGGQTRSGLYFEVRHKGRPVNPRKWCRGKPSGAAS
ncbi:septal ring factor EnvC (AmiA/AmiB activator) [Thiogranum longum]|uniref:Septal ring factor EnvC (AmiA/AmiB activator) n=1 Tax=Thiogranum longum TaxID=1537524 RepID=A0A4R1H9M8_9GAMM|nr:peptidoglycan DD-metalloendopeptidase family protein [Thiogranum longum]TCK16845.1 septal ring factor EnvC (AmiA/AmiB activator) [Thiogranum longum]